MNGFRDDAWASFKAVYGPILTVAAFVLAVFGAVYDPRAVVEVRVWWLVVVAVVLLTTAMVVGNMLQVARRLAKVRLPRVIHVDVASGPMPGGNEQTTLLLEQSELFGLGQPVTISHAEQLEQGRVFERRIGSGEVLNIQLNGLIQVRVLVMVPNQRELWQRIRQRERPTLAQIVVRPWVSINEDEAREAVE